MAEQPLPPEIAREYEALLGQIAGKKQRELARQARVPESMTAFQAAKRGFVSGLLETPKAIGTGVEWLGHRLESPGMVEAGKVSREYWKKTQEAYQPSRDIAGESWVDDPSLLLNASYMIYNTAQTVGTLIPTMMAGYVSGGAALAGARALGKVPGAIKVGTKAIPHVPENIARLIKIAQGVGAGAVGGEMEAASTYENMLAQGKPEKEAAIAATGMGLMSGLLNAIATPKLLSLTGKGLKQKLANRAVAGAWEASTEFLEEPSELASRYIAMLATGQELPEDIKGDIIQSLKDGLSVMPFAGLAGGVIAGGYTPETEGEGGPAAPPTSALEALKQAQTGGGLRGIVDKQKATAEEATKAKQARESARIGTTGLMGMAQAAPEMAARSGGIAYQMPDMTAEQALKTPYREVSAEQIPIAGPSALGLLTRQLAGKPFGYIRSGGRLIEEEGDTVQKKPLVPYRKVEPAPIPMVEGEKPAPEVMPEPGEDKVVRIEEKGGIPDWSKPQGVYVVPKGKEGLIEGLEGKRYEYILAPKNPLIVEEEFYIEHERGKGLTIPASSGIKALKKLTDEKEFVRLMGLSRKDLRAELIAKAPDVAWNQYYDSYEMLEGYAGLLAKQGGYDAIMGDPDESVILAESAIRAANPTPQSLAEQVNTDLPGHDLKFDGEFLGGLQFTPQAGPAKGATFTVDKGATAEDVRKALEEKIAKPPAKAPVTPEEEVVPAPERAKGIIETAREIDAAPNSLIGIRELRKQSGMDKEAFDAEIQRLIEAGKLIPHRHSDPAGLSEAEKAALVPLGNDLVVGVVIGKEEGAPEPAEEAKEAKPEPVEKEKRKHSKRYPWDIKPKEFTEKELAEFPNLPTAQYSQAGIKFKKDEIEKLKKLTRYGVSAEQAVFAHERGHAIWDLGIPDKKKRKLAEELKTIPQSKEVDVLDRTGSIGERIAETLTVFTIAPERLSNAEKAWVQKIIDLSQTFEEPAAEIAEAPAQGMPAPELESWAKKFTRGWKGAPKVMVFQSVNDLPPDWRYVETIEQAIATGMPIRGGHRGNTVFLIADNIPDIRQAETTLAHEVFGHAGLRKVLGNEWGPIMDAIWKDQGGTTGMQDFVKLYSRREGETLQNYHRRLADEKLARMAPEAMPATVWERIVAAVRKFLRDMGFTVEFSDNDMKVLLDSARRAAIEGKGKRMRVKSASAVSPMMEGPTQKIPYARKWPGSQKKVQVVHFTDQEEFRFDPIIMPEGETPGLFVYRIDELKPGQLEKLEQDWAGRYAEYFEVPESALHEYQVFEDDEVEEGAQGFTEYFISANDLTPTSEGGQIYQAEPTITPADVNTPEFKRWFGKSKVVDESGKPLVVYHGTTAPENFGEFAVGQDVSTEEDELYRTGSGGDPRTFLGSHFAKEANVASRFAEGLYGERAFEKAGGRVIPVYLNIINPYKTSDSGMMDEMLSGTYSSPIIDQILEEDGDIEETGEDYENNEEYRIDVNERALKEEQSADELYFELAQEMASNYRLNLENKGYDGIVYENEIEGGTSYIIFQPTQAKSIFNRGAWSPTEEDISLHVETAGERIRRMLTPEEKSTTEPEVTRENFGEAQKSTVDKVMDALEDIPNTWQRKLFDRLDPIRPLGREAYIMQRLETGIQSAVAGFMEHGILVPHPRNPKRFEITTRKEGFLPWYRTLGEDAKKSLYWMAAKRAEKLEAEDRELLLTKDKRKKILDWVGPKPETAGKTWEGINKEFQRFNKSILDVAQHAGLISAEERAIWEEDIYIPFNRIFEDEKTREEYLNGPVANRKYILDPIRVLKGSERKLGVPLENVIKNWSHLIAESIRNMARAEVVAAGNGKTATDLAGRTVPVFETIPKSKLMNILGSRTETKWAVIKAGKIRARNVFDNENDAETWKEYLNDQAGKNLYSIQARKEKSVFFGRMKDEGMISFMKNGKPVYIRVNDPEIYNALTNANRIQMDRSIMRFFGMAKRALTFGATFTPAFRIANMLRDTLHTAIISKSFVPFVDSFKGFAKAMREDQDFVSLMAGMGTFGSSYIKADDPKVLAKYIDRITRKEGKGATTRIINNARKALWMWEKIGSASENAARVQLYTKRLSEGVDPLEATFEARDLLDFSMSGDAAIVQYLISTVPFTNARLQGLYKLGRAAHSDPKGFAFKGGLLTLASLALWALNKDRDEYKELEDWDKRTYHHFWIGDNHFRIPKAFEVGAMFSTLFEAAADAMSDNEEIGYFTDTLLATAKDTFALNPLPQLIRPMIEQWGNKSFFTGRPIESEALKRLKPGHRYEPWTSETARLAGKFGISPKRFESIIRGYFAGFGMFLLGISDAFVYRIGDFPERPAMRIDDYPLSGRFWKQREPAQYTKYMTRFYDTMTEIDQLVATVNNYMRTGNFEAAKELAESNKRKLSLKPAYRSVRGQLSKINAQMKAVMMSTSLSSDEKRDRMNVLTRRRNSLVQNIYEIAQGGK